MIPNSNHNQDLAPDDTLSGVSLNYEWRQLVVPILYEGLFRYISEITDETERQTYIARVDALIDDIYTPEVTPMAEYHEATRASTQAIAANTDTKIQFNVGATPPQDWNVPVPAAGICTVTARVYLLSGVNGGKRARLLHNDVNIAELYYGSTAQAQLFSLSHVMEVDVGDYFSLEVNCVTASNSQIAPFVPKISMVIVP